MPHSYADIGDVQGQFKQLTFASTTTPTDTQVEDFITRAEAKVESIIGAKYVVPVTASAAVLILQQIVVDMVAGRVKNIIPVKTGAQEANQSKISEGDALIKDAMDTLWKIRSGEVILTGATLVSTNDGVRSYNVDNSICPKFQRGKTLW